jgi:4-amino-4-deoxy-L-arabinose transferase-like glycosyltransferase
MAEYSCSSSQRLSGLSRFIILLYGSSLLFIGLGNRTLTRHEVLAAYPAKEMLQHNHWIVPMFAGIPRTIKPPTTGWLIAGSMKLFHSDAEWVARLPSAIAGLLVALMIASFAARCLGDRAGLIAGLVQLTCFYTLMQARLAEADMPLCAAVTAAMLAFAYGLVLNSPSRFYPIAFYVFTGLAFLFKGPIGLMFIFSAVGMFLLIRRERRIVRFLLNPTGLIILAILLLAWPIAACISRPTIAAEWWHEMADNASGAFGRDPIYTYILSIPAVLMPWTPLIFIPIFRRLAGHPLRQFLLSWFLPGFFLLHLLAMRTKHYPIPLLPPFSILAAVGLIAYIAHQHRQTNNHHRMAASIFAFACAIAAGSMYFISITKPIAPRLSIVLALLLIGGLVTIYMEHLKRPRSQIAALFATLWLIIVGVHLLIIPTQDDYKFDAALARQANLLVPPDQLIYIIDPEPKVEPHEAYYSRPPILRARNEPEFVRAASTVSYVIATRAQADALASSGQVDILAQCESLHQKKSESTRRLLIKFTPKK